MKVGAILKSSISILEEILEYQKKANLSVKSYVKSHRFIGSKDKNFIYNIVYTFLKNYFTLMKICEKNHINFNIRNGVLLNFFNNNKSYVLKNIYEGKYSLSLQKQDLEIYKCALGIKKKILPSLPRWLYDKLSFKTKRKATLIYESILLESRIDLRVNTANVRRSDVLKILEENGINNSKTEISPIGLTIHKKISQELLKKIKSNLFEIQDEGSQIVTLLSGAKPKKKILDYCAGKGTKTLALYNEMNGEGELFAYDINKKRISFLKARLKKANIKKIKILSNLERYKNYFDLVMLDVPCSSSGTWRRRPEELIKLDRTVLSNIIIIQSQILQKASVFCKKNGILSYITCSIFMEENEKQISNFLKINKNFKKINFFKNNITNKKLFFTSDNWATISPCDFKTDGYFICLMKKIN